MFAPERDVFNLILGNDPVVLVLELVVLLGFLEDLLPEVGLGGIIFNIFGDATSSDLITIDGKPVLTS